MQLTFYLWEYVYVSFRFVYFLFRTTIYNTQRSAIPRTIRPCCRSVWSAGSAFLVVPTFAPSTVGIHAFEVSGPRIWNKLSEDDVSAPSLPTFRHRLKIFLFQKSYSRTLLFGILLLAPLFVLVVMFVTKVIPELQAE